MLTKKQKCLKNAELLGKYYLAVSISSGSYKYVSHIKVHSLLLEMKCDYVVVTFHLLSFLWAKLLGYSEIWR